MPRVIHRVLDEWQWNQWVSEEISALELYPIRVFLDDSLQGVLDW